jgi:serine/threonine protein kinase
MELVPGEDLAERLKRGPVALDEALEIAAQIAEGLEEAHEHGIAHRDLKPANVKLTPDGKVKVLDFGLAKACGGEASATRSGADLSQSPTLARTGTQAGVILGTAAYMSPEQARGKAVDKRTDIWAFGVVLYEMLTGFKPFGGSTVTDILAAVVKSEPDWSLLPQDTPLRVRDVLRRCLKKGLEARLGDIGDARLELAEALEPATVTPVSPGSPRADPQASRCACRGHSGRARRGPGRVRPPRTRRPARGPPGHRRARGRGAALAELGRHGRVHRRQEAERARRRRELASLFAHRTPVVRTGGDALRGAL